MPKTMADARSDVSIHPLATTVIAIRATSLLITELAMVIFTYFYSHDITKKNSFNSCNFSFILRIAKTLICFTFGKYIFYSLFGL